MGGVHSSDMDTLRHEELDELQEQTGFTRPQIRRLYARFKKLDQNATGMLTKADLTRIPELVMNPFNELVLSVFDFQGHEQEGGLNFLEFLQVMAVFNSAHSSESKKKVLFDILDSDKDGKITKDEFIVILKKMTGKNLTDAELSELADITLNSKRLKHPTSNPVSASPSSASVATANTNTATSSGNTSTTAENANESNNNNNHQELEADKKNENIYLTFEEFQQVFYQDANDILTLRSSEAYDDHDFDDDDDY